MSGLLRGVRVLEVAEYGMVPAAGAVLSDWGADVIKVEHAHRGDPVRNVVAMGIGPGIGGFSGLWEVFNRGKRAIGIDMADAGGHEVLLKLAKSADIFLTNFLPRTRQKLRIDVEDVRAVNPNIIYARGSAHGPKGPEAGRGGFDGLTYWLRSGAGMAATPALSEELVTLPGPAFGDIQTGMALAGGIAAALFARERTGKPVTVDISLLSSGLWAMQGALFGANVSGKQLPRSNRRAAINPLSNNYATSDGRRIALSMHQPDTYWQRLCELWGRPDLIDDPRFSSMAQRNDNNVACIQELDAIFIKRTLKEWIDILSKQDGQWTAVQLATDANDDPQAWENGFLQRVDYGDGRQLTLVAAPVQFDETPPQLRRAPDRNAHTQEILAEAGFDRSRQEKLRESGAIA